MSAAIPKLTRLVFVLLGIILAFSHANAAQTRGGQWWNSLSDDQKIIFIVGFFDGQTYAAQLFDGSMLIAQEDPKTKKWDPNRARVLSEAEKIATTQLGHDFGNYTAGQLVRGLDIIYANYQNARIEVAEAVIVVVRSMDGTSADEIEKLLERKRKAATQ